MPVSLRDVAAKAGVSSNTVSSVINNKTSARISSETQRRVRQVAAEMGYRPNSFARSIARKKTSTLRLITSSHDNPFFVAVAKSVDAYTRKSGYKLWVDATLDQRWTYGPGEEVGIWPVDGALIWADEVQDLEKYLGGQAGEIPVVYLGHQGSEAVDTVTSDLYIGGRQAAEHLVERGYKKIAYLSQDFFCRFPGQDKRMKAYEDVCAEVGMPIKHFHFKDQFVELECMLSLDAGMEIAALPAGERPDAIICLNDMIAVGLYHGIRRAGLRIPEDIAVVGFDGSFLGRCLDRPLTTIAIPTDAMCKAAVDMLVRRIQGDAQLRPHERIVLPTQLVAGRTT
jgi:DNA-binding LacI/PurR family transcriptional regulator